MRLQTVLYKYRYTQGCGRSSGVERYLAKVNVVSSNLIARSTNLLKYYTFLGKKIKHSSFGMCLPMCLPTGFAKICDVFPLFSVFLCDSFAICRNIIKGCFLSSQARLVSSQNKTQKEILNEDKNTAPYSSVSDDSFNLSLFSIC